jgi:hypothetical protein
MTTIMGQREFILEYLVDHVAETSDQPPSNDSMVLDCLTELLKLRLRDVANSRERSAFTRIGIWDESLRKVKADLVAALPDVGKQLLSHHEQEITTTLKPVVKEMERLRKALSAARDRDVMIDRETVQHGVPVPFEIVSIGTRRNLQALVVMPLDGQTYRLDTLAIREVGSLDGEWFPYEITIDEMTFVIDDDGRLSIAVENFPAILLQKAYQTIRTLAERSYSRL